MLAFSDAPCPNCTKMCSPSDRTVQSEMTAHLGLALHPTPHHSMAWHPRVKRSRSISKFNWCKTIPTTGFSRVVVCENVSNALIACFCTEASTTPAQIPHASQLRHQQSVEIWPRSANALFNILSQVMIWIHKDDIRCSTNTWQSAHLGHVVAQVAPPRVKSGESQQVGMCILSHRDFWFSPLNCMPTGRSRTISSLSIRQESHCTTMTSEENVYFSLGFRIFQLKEIRLWKCFSLFVLSRDVLSSLLFLFTRGSTDTSSTVRL